MFSFIFIPLILAGCVAYSFKASREAKVISGEILENKADLNQIHREFDGQQ